MKIFRFNSLLVIFALTIFFSCDDKKEIPVGLLFEINQDITENTVWLSGNIYEVSGLVRVDADIVIEPGTTVRFKKDAALELGYWDNTYATLKAIGTPDKPIIFTSASATPAPGDHGGIRLYNGASNCEFSYCIFEYGGSDAYFGTVYMIETDARFTANQFRHARGNAIIVKENAAFTEFTGNEFTNIEMHPVTIYPYSAHTIDSGNIFSPNYGYGIYLDGAGYEMNKPGNYTWAAHDAPYLITDEIRINSGGNGVNLTIAPGTTLKFSNNGSLSVAYWDGQNGKLIAEGTTDSPIIFTSNELAVQKGDWDGLIFYDGCAGSSLSHCQINFAGRNEYNGAFLLYNAGHNTVSLTHSRIAHSKSHAIRVYQSSMDYSTVVFEDNNGDDYSEL